MIKYNEEEGFIEVKGIHFKDDYKGSKKLPSVAIGIFSKLLVDSIAKKYNCQEIGWIKNASFNRSVYLLNYEGEEFVFFGAGVGAPVIAADIEELYANGVRKIIIFGSCGVLDNTIEDCTILIPTRAYRDEGTSYHYMKSSKYITLNKKYKKEFKEILKKYNFNYKEGYTWTTDAIYKETKSKIKYFKDAGCICVEMESSAEAAVTKYRGMDLFTFFYACDNLDAVKWEERSLSCNVKLDVKSLIAKFAFELALKIKKETNN